MVDILGCDALERYCRHGRLGNDCLDKLNSAVFTKSDIDEASGPMDEEFEDAGESCGDANAGPTDANEEGDDESEESHNEDGEDEDQNDKYKNPEVESADDSD